MGVDCLSAEYKGHWEDLHEEREGDFQGAIRKVHLEAEGSGEFPQKVGEILREVAFRDYNTQVEDNESKGEREERVLSPNTGTHF